MKRIAIPIESNKLSQYLGKCKHFEIVEIDENSIKRNLVKVPYFNIKTELTVWLAGLGVTDVIMYKTDYLMLKILQTYKVNLFIGIRTNVPDDLINDYQDGKLCSDGKIISEIIDNHD